MGGPEKIVEGLNHWLRVNHAKEISLDDVMALKDREDVTVEEKKMGVPIEPGYGETVERQGLTHYIASFPSEDGVVRTRLMCTMNMPHWPTPEMSYQAFEFMGHFRRDLTTFASIYEE